MAQFPYYTLNVQCLITKNVELSINTIRYIHEGKNIDVFSIICFWRFGIFPHSEKETKYIAAFHDKSISLFSPLNSCSEFIHSNPCIRYVNTPNNAGRLRINKNVWRKKDLTPVETFQMRYCRKFYLKGHQNNQKPNFGFPNLLHKMNIFWSFWIWFLSIQMPLKIDFIQYLIWKVLLIVKKFVVGKDMVAISLQKN